MKCVRVEVVRSRLSDLTAGSLKHNQCQSSHNTKGITNKLILYSINFRRTLNYIITIK